MTDRELLQMALDALENAHANEPIWKTPIKEAIKALRSRLANEFNPDWDQIEALQESLREHMAEIQRLRARLAQPEQEPVAWMHNFIDEVVIAHRPVDLDRHPDRWTALYKDPTPCQTCEALSRTVMMDQTSHDTPPRHRELPTLDLSAPLTVNGVPMYPQREWQGLTKEEYEAMAEKCVTNCYFDTLKYARAIEARLRDKNS